jgi:hypothetical protein
MWQSFKWGRRTLDNQNENEENANRNRKCGVMYLEHELDNAEFTNALNPIFDTKLYI